MVITQEYHADFVPWDEFNANFVWKQGQHVILIGPNGSGKTVLNKRLLLYRQERNGYICAFVTKPYDPELEDMQKNYHYLRVKDNRDWSARSWPRLLLWPPAGEFADLRVQRDVFLRGLQGMWTATRWTVMLNELRYLTEMLKLRDQLNTLYLQARASKFSLTGETQRPRNVPLEAFSQATHLFFAACRDDEDLKRISGLGNADSKQIRYVVQGLRQYEFCYVNSITGEVVRTITRPFEINTKIA